MDTHREAIHLVSVNLVLKIFIDKKLKLPVHLLRISFDNNLLFVFLKRLFLELIQNIRLDFSKDFSVKNVFKGVVISFVRFIDVSKITL